MDDIDGLRFEEAFALLEQTLDEMRQDGLTLDRALALFERGTRLSARCDRLLAEAELRVTELGPTQGESITRVVRESLADGDW